MKTTLFSVLKNCLLIFLVVTLLSSCGSTFKINRSIHKVAKAKIKSYVIPESIYRGEWGMKSYKLYRPVSLYDNEFYGSISKKDKAKITERNLKTERWCKGKNDSGKVIKLRLELVWTLKVLENGTFEMGELGIGSAKPLTFGRQMLSWLGAGLLFIIFIIFSCGFQPSVFVPGILIFLPIVMIIISYSYFMSGWGILLGLVIFGIPALMIAIAKYFDT